MNVTTIYRRLLLVIVVAVVAVVSVQLYMKRHRLIDDAWVRLVRTGSLGVSNEKNHENSENQNYEVFYQSTKND